jgi:competence protein ComEA
MVHWFERFKPQLIWLLIAIVVIQSGVIAWLLFRPSPDDSEWRTVNQEMEQTLEKAGAKDKNSDQQLTKQDSKQDKQAAKQDKPKTSEATPTWPINLNTATQQQLEQLPRIGPSKAQAIIQLRTQLGGFTSVEQLLQVKGIGDKTFAELRDKVTVQNQ